MLSLTRAIKSFGALPAPRNLGSLPFTPFRGLLRRLSAGSVFCFGFAFCLSGSRAVPARGGDESVGALPVGVPDTRISSDASHFSALGDPVTGLSEKMRFFKKLFLARVKGPVSFSFSVFLFFS